MKRGETTLEWNTNKILLTRSTSLTTVAAFGIATLKSPEFKKNQRKLPSAPFRTTQIPQTVHYRRIRFSRSRHLQLASSPLARDPHRQNEEKKNTLTYIFHLFPKGIRRGSGPLFKNTKKHIRTISPNSFTSKKSFVGFVFSQITNKKKGQHNERGERKQSPPKQESLQTQTFCQANNFDFSLLVNRGIGVFVVRSVDNSPCPTNLPPSATHNDKRNQNRATKPYYQ